MATKTINESILTDIGNAIRTKNNQTTQYGIPTEMVNAIKALKLIPNTIKEINSGTLTTSMTLSGEDGLLITHGLSQNPNLAIVWGDNGELFFGSSTNFGGLMRSTRDPNDFKLTSSGILLGESEGGFVFYSSFRTTFYFFGPSTGTHTYHWIAIAI